MLKRTRPSGGVEKHRRYWSHDVIAVAEANFSALYGYDIRGKVFGPAGMVMMGDVRRSSMTLFDAHGVSKETWRRDTDHFIHGYTAQLASFITAVRQGEMSGGPGGLDARNALAIALACIESGIPKTAGCPELMAQHGDL